MPFCFLLSIPIPNLRFSRRNASAVEEAEIRARKMRQKIRIAAKRERGTENEIGVGRKGRNEGEDNRRSAKRKDAVKEQSRMQQRLKQFLSFHIFKERKAMLS